MAKAASLEYLRKGFEKHLEQTKGTSHASNRSSVPWRNQKGKKCMGMEGLIKEGSEVIGEDFEGAVMDAALIGAAQRVEHSRLRLRGCARICQGSGPAETRFFARRNSEQRKRNRRKVNRLIREINAQAIEEGPEEERAKPGQVRKMPKRVA